ncbi:hypothetical protein [Oscillatoria sp. FACHB-1406]|uniref:hypothetical protein n=1 Tax=Oscillatoria sp. FACHB-1406 TaxID=2692846 RepID=UPI001683B931|nr:hypothetical protein [Oscillatoria sp. FACHB-1406]MBD2578081.1 hypothetical protein [Oscillatoria sp. FACHB-1406]
MNTKLSQIGTALIASSFFISSSLVSASAAPKTPQLLAQNQYPQNLRNEYMNACKQRAMAEGLNQSQAQRLCQCTLGRLQARFTTAQFRALNRRAAETGQTPQAFTDIGMACYRQLNS